MGVIARALFLAATAVLCAAALFRWVYVPVRCSFDLTTLTRRTYLASTTPGDYDRIVRTRQNLERLAAMREHCRADVRVPMLAAENERLVGRHEDAVRSYHAALEVERRPEIYNALGETLLATGRLDEALESYTTVVRFNAGLIDTIPSPEIRQRVQERLDGRP